MPANQIDFAIRHCNKSGFEQNISPKKFLPGCIMTTKTPMIFTALCWIWCGLIIGVSFLATPAKFLADGLSLPIALDIGRQTFNIFFKLEFFLMLCLAAVCLNMRRHRPDNQLVFGLVALVAGIVIAEIFWLLPALDARVQIIIDGGTTSRSYYHLFYVVFELAKFLVLFTLPLLVSSTRKTRSDLENPS